MKMTIITNRKGEIVGSTQGSYSQLGIVKVEKDERTEISVGLLPGPDQEFIEIEVPNEFAEYDASELHERLKGHVSKSRNKGEKK